uniref:Carboxylic ester hydrolase n=1 Tax=Fopius arisanus TaxID=64838 RepID=A0A0C9QW59_9HYME
MESPQVEIDTGKLRGSRETNVHGREFIAFKGIPYAQPPVGELRFQDCRPPLKWSGVREATSFGDNCAHIDLITYSIVGSDDCLYLNVYTPSIHPEIPKAVMVWIHGGGFIFGSGDDTLYGPDYLIEKDIVLVTINYRLGVLGFLDLEDEIANGNQGLKDQVMALQWIKRNIDRFGGDPGNVTIFGESAGSASVHFLCVSPMGEGLFEKAILQSGVLINPWATIARSPKRSACQLAAVLGKEIEDPKELLHFLKSIDVHELIKAQAKMFQPYDKILLITPFGPAVDSLSKNPFLSKPLFEAIKSGIKVPCIIGYVSDEGLVALSGERRNHENPYGKKTFLSNWSEIDENYQTTLIHPNAVKHAQMKNLTVMDMRKIYFGNRKISLESVQNYVDLQGDTHFIAGIHEVLDHQVQVSKNPTYVYKFDCDTGNSIVKLSLNITQPGTCHGDELSLLFYPKIFQQFGIEFPNSSDIHQLLTERFTQLWTNFAKTGNPTPSKSDLLPVMWTPLTRLQYYDCMKISDSLEMTTEENVYTKIKSCLKNKL